VTLSSFYMDVTKDTLYTKAKRSGIRLAVQTVMAKVLDTLLRLLAPLSSFTAEEAYRMSPLKKKFESIFLCEFPTVKTDLENRELAYEFTQLLEVRNEVLKSLEVERAQGRLRASIDAGIHVAAKDESLAALLRKYSNDLAELFIVSEVILEDWDNMTSDVKGAELAVLVGKPSGTKCVRCWLWSETTGTHPEHPGICDKCYEAVTSE